MLLQGMERKPQESHQKLDLGTATLELANLPPPFLPSARVVGSLVGRWLRGSCFQAECRHQRDLTGSQMPCSSVHLPLCLCACELTGLARVLGHGVEEEWELPTVFPEVSEKRHGLPLEGLPWQCGAQHLVGFLKEVRFKTSNV